MTSTISRLWILTYKRKRMWRAALQNTEAAMGKSKSDNTGGTEGRSHERGKKQDFIFTKLVTFYRKSTKVSKSSL